MNEDRILTYIDDNGVATITLNRPKAMNAFEDGMRETLLERLDATPDVMSPGKSLLDTTVVVWAKEMGDPRLHSCESVPFVLAGGTDHFDLGRYLRFPGQNHQKLLVSLCHSVGLSNPTFGDPSHGTGPLAGLTR